MIEKSADIGEALTKIDDQANSRLLAIPYHSIRLILLMVSDSLAFFISSLFLLLLSPGTVSSDFIFIITSIVLGSIIFSIFNLYNRDVKPLIINQLPRIFYASLSLAVFYSIISIFTDSLLNESRDVAIMWMATLVLVSTFRVPVTFLENVLRRREIGLRRTLIIGAGKIGTEMATRIIAKPENGYKIVGFVDEDPPENIERDQLDQIIFKEEDNLGWLVNKYNVEHIIIAFSKHSYERSLKVIRECENLPVSFSIVPRLFEAVSDRSRVEAVVGIPLVNIPKLNPIGSHWWIKRMLDLSLSLTLLILTLPIVAILAILIKRDSQGPVFFKQKRVGKDSRQFTFYKFRTMYADARTRFPDLYKYEYSPDQIREFKFKIADDQRLTKLGSFLRKTSLDELPNLFNVIKGDMSFVGPRPDIPEMIKYYREDQVDKLKVLPGVTGLAQINGRGLLTFQETLDLDVNYARNQSLQLDTQILFRTLIHVIKGIGAF